MEDHKKNFTHAFQAEMFPLSKGIYLLMPSKRIHAAW